MEGRKSTEKKTQLNSGWIDLYLVSQRLRVRQRSCHASPHCREPIPSAAPALSPGSLHGPPLLLPIAGSSFLQPRRASSEVLSLSRTRNPHAVAYMSFIFIDWRSMPKCFVQISGVSCLPPLFLGLPPANLLSFTQP
jgi:hypothetical protein